MTVTSHRLLGILALGSLALATLACGARESKPAAASAPTSTTATATAAATSTPTSATAADQDLRSFVARRQQCDHFRGEEGSTPKRQAELAAKLKEFCTGSDAQLAALKKKYRDDKAASKTLAGFNDNIE
jgi:hypothetical protein